MVFSLTPVSSRGPIGLAVVAVLAAAALLALPGSTAAGPRAGTDWAAGAFSADAAIALSAAPEHSRDEAGDASLVVDPALTAVARWRSRDMVERAYFSHDIPDVGTVLHQLDAVGERC